MKTSFFAVSIFAVLIASGQNTIRSYEYWFNGNYTGVQRQNIAAATQYTLNTLVPAASLPDGLHIFNLRFKDDSARYSPTLSQFFYKETAPVAGTRKINAYQYWFNNAFGSATLQAVSAVASITVNAPITTVTLPNGLHLFHIRFRNDLGQWSSSVSQFFYKAETLPTPVTNLVSGYQYWFNNDFANASTTAITPVSPYQLSAPINTNALSKGLHLLHLRFKDQRGQWSAPISQFIYTMSTADVAQPNAMSRMQYWFGTDMANAINKPLPQQKMVQVTEMIDASSMPDGLHLMHLRFADTTGKWSSTISQFFYKSKEVGITNNVITGYRYWFNNATAENIVYHRVSPTNPFEFIAVLDMGCLTNGDNRLMMQFRDSAGQWSAPMVDTITVTAPADKTLRFIGNGNWSNSANWKDGMKPAPDAPNCREIIIDHVAGGTCILDVPQTMLKNSTLIVMPGKKLIVPSIEMAPQQLEPYN